MEKIMVAALAALLVLASDAAVSSRRGLRLDKRKIMENAVRVNNKGERLLEEEQQQQEQQQQEQQQEKEDFELSAGYSIQFRQCVSLRTEPYSENTLFAQSLLAYTSKGQIVSQKSYILFNVCKTKKCAYEGDDNIFMVDIDTYIASISEFYLDMKENYCEACRSSANYCRFVAYQKKHGNQFEEYQSKYADWENNEAEEAADEWEEEMDGEWNEEWGEEQNWEDYYGYNGANEAQAEEDAEEEQQQQQQQAEDNQDEDQGERKLQYGAYHPIHCDTCDTYSCFDAAQKQYENGGQRRLDGEEEEDDQYQYQYYDTGDAWSIAGWVEDIAGCKATSSTLDGTWKLYAGFICNQDGSGVDIGLFLDQSCSIYTSRQSFKNVASSYDQTHMYDASLLMTYPTVNTVSCNGEYLSRQEFQQMQANYNQGGEQQYGEASEFCQSLFEGGEAGEAVSLDDCNQDGEEDQQAENAQVNQYYDYDYDWYNFELTYEDSMSTEATCLVLRAMRGEYTSVYSWRGSGQLYNYGSGPIALWEMLRPYVITGLVAGSVLLATALYCTFKSRRLARLKRLEEEDTKREALIARIQKQKPDYDSDDSARAINPQRMARQKKLEKEEEEKKKEEWIIKKRSDGDSDDSFSLGASANPQRMARQKKLQKEKEDKKKKEWIIKKRSDGDSDDSASSAASANSAASADSDASADSAASAASAPPEKVMI